MTDQGPIRIELFADGELETGIWCPRCAKPSMVRQSYGLLGDSGVSVGASYTACTDCEPELPTMPEVGEDGIPHHVEVDEHGVQRCLPDCEGWHPGG